MPVGKDHPWKKRFGARRKCKTTSCDKSAAFGVELCVVCIRDNESPGGIVVK